MPLRNLLIIVSVFFMGKTLWGEVQSTALTIHTQEELNILIEEFTFVETGERPNPIIKLFRAKQNKNKKITAAILAFPFPFGIVGLHRIYLGCAPYVPVVYIASLGGAFGVVPFIDFCVILLDKNIENYVNNKKVFMWVN